MDWERVNIWTNTLYTLIQSIEIARHRRFGDLTEIGNNILSAATWTSQQCSYASVLVSEPFGNHKVTFRRDPNKHFQQIASQIIKMLIQDLVTIMDEMLSEALAARKEKAGTFPQSKIEKLSLHLSSDYKWAAHGCLELIAARNVLTHSNGRWNEKSIAIVKTFVTPAPKNGDRLIIGFPMLFRYRKAMRTFLNEIAPKVSASAPPGRIENRRRVTH